MTTSGTYAFNPALGSLALSAYSRIQVRPAELTHRHMFDAKQESNFLLSEISNLQPNLWTVGLTSTALTEGTANYDVADQTVMILDAYITTTSGGEDTDRYILPISRTEYASYPNKDTEGFPTVYWYDRLINQTITLWPVPDGNGPYTLNYYSCRQVQDANYVNGQNIELPYRFLDAFVAGLAHRLARIYAPQLEQLRAADYQRAWDIAATQDVENVSLFITPGMSGYYS